MIDARRRKLHENSTGNLSSIDDDIITASVRRASCCRLFVLIGAASAVNWSLDFNVIHFIRNRLVTRESSSYARQSADRGFWTHGNDDANEFTSVTRVACVVDRRTRIFSNIFRNRCSGQRTGQRYFDKMYYDSVYDETPKSRTLRRVFGIFFFSKTNVLRRHDQIG